MTDYRSEYNWVEVLVQCDDVEVEVAEGGKVAEQKIRKLVQSASSL